jgi:hypothetical protein
MQERAPDAVSACAAARAAARSTSLQPRRGPTLSRQHPGSPFHVVSLHGCTGTANPPRATASVQPSQNLAEQQWERRDRSSLSSPMFARLQTSVCQQAEDGRCTHMWARPSPGRLGVRTLPRSIDQRLAATSKTLVLCGVHLPGTTVHRD